MNVTTQQKTRVTVRVTELQRRMLLNLVARALTEVGKYLESELNDNQRLYIADLEATADALKPLDQEKET